MYDPIYSQNIGLCGFRCRVGACRKVVPTYRGIVMHCKRVHGLKAQIEMFDPPGIKEKQREEVKTAEQLESVRDQRTAEERDVLECFAKLKPDAAGKY